MRRAEEGCRKEGCILTPRSPRGDSVGHKVVFVVIIVCHEGLKESSSPLTF
jgi:hypothetical protein